MDPEDAHAVLARPGGERGGGRLAGKGIGVSQQLADEGFPAHSEQDGTAVNLEFPKWQQGRFTDAPETDTRATTLRGALEDAFAATPALRGYILDEKLLTEPRKTDGSLPEIRFMRIAPTSAAVDISALKLAITSGSPSGMKRTTRAA